MDNTVLVAIITAIGSIITTLLTVGLPLLKRNKQLKTENEAIEKQNKEIGDKNKEFEKKVEQIASTGIALGYYFNFIETIYKSIEETPKLLLEIYDTNDSSIVSRREFSSDKIRIEILMPRSLEGAAFTQVKGKLSEYKKGDIVRTGNKRNFGVNYAIQNDDTLVIIDVPTPLFALEKYLEKLPEYKDYIDPASNVLISMKETENYKVRQNKEIENFKSTIISFIKAGEYAVNKVHFNQIM